MAWRFNAPPGWPAPPAGWVPPAGWTPDPSWPPAPEGWAFWVEDTPSSAWGAAGGPAPTPATTGPPPSGRGRGVGRVILIVVVVVLLVALVGAAVSVVSWVTGRTETQTLVTQATTSDVRVDDPCGSITLREGTAGVVTTRARIRSSWSQPRVTSRVEGDVVQVRVECPAFGIGSSVSLVVEVPPDGAVDARSSAGSVSAEGLSSDLTLRSSAGSVSATEVTAKRVSAESSAGSVSLSWAASADPTTISATSSAGSVRVSVPDRAGVAWRVDADSSAGSTTVQVRTDPQSSRTITARSSAGSVVVGYR